MIALLFLVGFIGLHWKLILSVVVLVAVYRYGREYYGEYVAAQLGEYRRQLGLMMRADQQHAEVLRGDEHGTYGSATRAQREFEDLTG